MFGILLESPSEAGGSRIRLLLLLRLLQALRKHGYFFFSFVFKNQKSYPRGHQSFLAHPVLVFGISNGMLQSSGPVLQMSRARTCGDDSFQVCMCHLIGPTCLVSGQMLLLLAYIPMLLYTAHHML